MDNEKERFFNSDDQEIEFFREAASSKNTKRSTSNWINVFNEWAKVRGVNSDITDIPPLHLDKLLSKFYEKVKKDGTDYEPSCLI